MENNWLNLMHLLQKWITENKLHLQEKELYDKFVAERNNEINTLNNKTNYDKLKNYFKSEDTIPISFDGFNCPIDLTRKIKDGSIDLEKAKKKSGKIENKSKWNNKRKMGT